MISGFDSLIDQQFKMYRSYSICSVVSDVFGPSFALNVYDNATWKEKFKFRQNFFLKLDPNTYGLVSRNVQQLEDSNNLQNFRMGSRILGSHVLDKT